MARVAIDPLSQVPLFVKMQFGSTELASGTAFFYRREDCLYLISNWHNFAGRHPRTNIPLASHGGTPDQISCYACMNLPHIKREWIQFNLVENSVPLWFEHPVQGGNVDIAALPVTLDQNHRAFPLNDCHFTDMPLQVSHDVYVLGYPLGLMSQHGLPVWKPASVATEPGTSDPHFYIDTATRSGMSGSAVISRHEGFFKNDPTTVAIADDDWFGQGQMFVGVYSGRLGASEVEAQLGIVWKAVLVDEVIDGRKAAKC